MKDGTLSQNEPLVNGQICTVVIIEKLFCVFSINDFFSTRKFVESSSERQCVPPPPAAAACSRITKNGEVVYFLAEPHVDHLTQAKGWLAERVKSCEQSEGSVRGRACADSVLTVRQFFIRHCCDSFYDLFKREMWGKSDLVHAGFESRGTAVSYADPHGTSALTFSASVFVSRPNPHPISMIIYPSRTSPLPPPWCRREGANTRGAPPPLRQAPCARVPSISYFAYC